ncbi:hypothetical protein GCM10011348_44970 [Marinobacterium nitratireducens]|uniref:DUF3108 domain-containing protein n=1 Tax=Marinobacterium nitratireducens TaxID=518897 RepID=A0A917ZPD8_9GAMM|nr:DUF3108 domain-containing protein [Marinobacterium nitratireducens]GGO88762.1 hypothetical protein GCM10011348_44970 [Marinobacterium nitratireducens]
MHRPTRLWLLMPLMLPTALQASEPLLESHYEARYRGFDLELARTLTPLGNQRYRFESIADSALARIEESSTFTRDSRGKWTPLEYSYRQKIFGLSKGYELKFDESAGKATYSDGDGKKQISIEPDTLDPLLYQLRMQHDIARKRGSYSYHFLRRTKLKQYSFKVEGQDVLTLNGEGVEAMRLVKDDGADDTRIWFSETDGYQLTRMTYTDDGETYEIKLDHASTSPAFADWIAE